MIINIRKAELGISEEKYYDDSESCQTGSSLQFDKEESFVTY